MEQTHIDYTTSFQQDSQNMSEAGPKLPIILTISKLRMFYGTKLRKVGYPLDSGNHNRLWSGDDWDQARWMIDL